jgi:hypothetical protein
MTNHNNPCLKIRGNSNEQTNNEQGGARQRFPQPSQLHIALPHSNEETSGRETHGG